MSTENNLSNFKNIFKTLLPLLDSKNITEAKEWVNKTLCDLEAKKKTVEENKKDPDYAYLYCPDGPSEKQKQLRENIMSNDLAAVMAEVENKMNVVYKKDGILYSRDNGIVGYGFYKAIQYDKKEIALYLLEKLLEYMKYDEIVRIVIQADSCVDFLPDIYRELYKREDFRNSYADGEYLDFMSGDLPDHLYKECLKAQGTVKINIVSH